MVSYLLGLEKMMKADLVLILIVVEDGLVLIRSDNGEHMLISLNPIVVEDGLVPTRCSMGNLMAHQS